MQLLLLMVAFAVGLPSDLHPIESTVTGPRLEYNCNTGLAVEDIRVDLTQQREDLTEIIFRNCNLTELDFGFLAGFPDLRFLHVDGGSLVEFTGMPYVRDLTRAYIWTPDFRKWWGPGLTPQLWSVSLKFIADDASINRIVDSILSYKGTLTYLYIEDSYFTTFPPRIREFEQLQFFIFDGNHQVTTLTNATFPASFTPDGIYIRDSNITMIEPGTFSGDTGLFLLFLIRFLNLVFISKGNFRGRGIEILGSSLPRLEEEVFAPVLRTMNPAPGGFKYDQIFLNGKFFKRFYSGRLFTDLSDNHFKWWPRLNRLTSDFFIQTEVGPCDCSLSWLNRDNRQWLVNFGKAQNNETASCFISGLGWLPVTQINASFFTNCPCETLRLFLILVVRLR